LLRRKHSRMIRQDRKAFRAACVRGLYKRFPLPTGRPRSVQLDRAERLRGRGMKWNAICLEIEPNYKNWDVYRRHAFRQKVQAGLRGRNGRKKLGATKRAEKTAVVQSSASHYPPE
jgi:hypothetical protein